MSTLVTAPNQGRSILNGFAVFLLAGEKTGGNFALIEHNLAPGQLAAPIHTHQNEDEYSYVLEGEMSARIGTEILTAPAGSLILKPRHIPHTFWNQGSQAAKILEIISPAGFEKYFDELAEIRSVPGVPDAARLAVLRVKYALEMDLASVPILGEKYGVYMR
ncbi:MAG: cupin domain-containing protein [Anaerolineales bacterium]